MVASSYVATLKLYQFRWGLSGEGKEQNRMTSDVKARLYVVDGSSLN